MKIRLAGLVDDSIVDGPGYRFTVFVQGCPHNCPGCHNPQSHDFDGGYEGDTDEIFAKIMANRLLQGVTFSGGEPMEQAVPLLALAKKIKAAGLDLWIYTGYTYEALREKISRRADDPRQQENNDAIRQLLSIADVLVDGPFILEQRDIELCFRGSRNQRILDLKEMNQ